MRIHRIALTDVRGFGPRVEVELDPAGVTVIEAPNETGKSTLFDAVDVALRYKDSSKHRDVKSLWPVDRDAPCTIEVELSCGGTHLVLTRTYRRSPATVLRLLAPTPATHSGDEAHDRLREVLDAEVDQTLYEALRFTQGRDLDAVALGASGSLTAALDRAAGGEAGQEDGALFDRVERTYLHWFTSSGRARDPLSGPAQRLAQATEQLEELRARAAALSADAEALAEVEQELPTLDRQRDEQLRPQLEQVRERRREVDAAKASTDAASARVATAAAELERARERRERREQLRRQRDELAEQVAADEAASAPARERLQQLQAALERGEAQLSDAQGERDTAERARERAQLALDLHDADRRLEVLADRVARVEELRAAVGPKEDELAAIAIDDAAIAQLADAQREVHVAEAQQRVGAPTVRLAPTRDLEVDLDGEPTPLAAGAAHTVTVASSFVLEDPAVGRLEVVPGDRADALREAVVDAKDRLARACRALGVDGLADAERRRDRHRELLGAVTQDRRDLERLLEGSDADALAGELRRARGRRDGLAERLEDDARGTSPAPDHEALLRARDEAGAAARDAATALDAARTQRAQLAGAVQEQHTAVQVARSTLAGMQERLADLETQLAEERAALDDAALDAAVDTAEQAHRALQATAASARAALEELDPDLVAFEVDRLSTALEAVEERRAALGERAAQLRGSLAVRGQEGIGELLQAAEDEYDRARAADERAQARAAAARCLYEAMAAAREEAYQAYRAPLRDAVGALARKLYGREVELDLDDELAISQRTLDGVTLPFEQLSAGAREQLAILAALAAAELAGEDGVPFVLDDALGYTDLRRLERLGALLGQVEDAQVVVLTCLAERFRHVGNARIVALQDLRRAAADQPTLGAVD
ncbi:MAG: hypothetical protein JJT89_03610 [Nitriliruptoraceae bacterium]|nr:hypothetical protein [Nitriliruptoraceae bacterium]